LNASQAVSISRITLLKTACWLIIGSFTLGSLAMHRLLLEAAKPNSGIDCGNTVTDPLGAMLSFGAPLGAAAVVPLGILWRRGSAKGLSVVPAFVLVGICTTSLLLGGIQFFRGSLPGFHLSDIVWWLRPVGTLLGI
jgi:hypothetical protein